MNAKVCVLIFLCAASCCLAVDMTNNEGKVFKDAKVTRVEPDGVTISHSGGVAKLFFWELPESVQQQYGYNATNAAAYDQQINAAQQKEYQAEKARETAADQEVEEVYSNQQSQVGSGVSTPVDGSTLLHRHVDKATKSGGQSKPIEHAAPHKSHKL
jgi:hypothetical protein